ncbi:MAG: histidine kinase [Cyclobacteriaceae bacterium]|nr:MAG: histidine kinase [Cyclobacteriaceae bacterium]
MIEYKERLYWILQISVWLVYALLQSVVFSLMASELSWSRIVFFVAEALLCFAVTHYYRLCIKKWRWLSLPLSRLIPRVVISVIFMGLMVYFLRVPVSYALSIRSVENEAFRLAQIAGYSAFYIFLLFLWSVFYFTYHYIERYNKSLRYEASRIQSELNNLKAQLNPHFIFNALNSIRALVDEDPDKAKQAITQLSNILRNSLSFGKKGLTRFSEELEIVKDYLSLESIRFEERLKTEFNIHPESEKFLVPPFMIQTLVENGVKHGISRLKDGGLIQVSTSVENNQLVIRIRNSGQLVNGIKKSISGVGLQNTIKRLRLLYGDDAHFSIVNENPNFVRTEIIIPKTVKR